MKKLGKLSINPEKVIKNDQLVNLRGGYESCDPLTQYTCSCKDANNIVLGEISYSGNVDKGGDCWQPVTACQVTYPTTTVAGCFKS